MRGKWKYVALALVGSLLLLLAPVVFRQVRPVVRRPLNGAKLAEVPYREVRFRNAAQDIDLAGMLIVPEGEGPFPAVVVIHGSGTSRRDNPWYLTLCEFLRANGIVVLLPDKRGSEQSQGNWRTSSFEDLGSDTLAAIELLQQLDDIPISQIGIVGMSQGGHIAPLVADRAQDVTFVVNVVGGSVPMRQALLYEENHNLREMGLLPGVSNVVAHFSTAHLVNVSQKDFWNAIGNFDPLPYWRKLDVPTLTLYGSDDTNVDTKANAARLRSLENPNIEVQVFEGSGHALEDPEGKGDRIFREDALRTICDFIFKASTATIIPTET